MAFQKGDFEAAVELARPLAVEGDARAQSTLGFVYYRGRGAPQDYNEAIKWFRRAADQGAASAQFRLGVMFSDGRGVPQITSRQRSGIASLPIGEMPLRNTTSGSLTPRAKWENPITLAHTCGLILPRRAF